ncbi:MAG: PAS domain S-box protein [Deltaproteobacteria bacterium]|nr:PAS domain S-box protein [Candidatus Zymogenaceae bacterium]
MKDERKTKAELIRELSDLRKRVKALESSSERGSLEPVSADMTRLMLVHTEDAALVTEEGRIIMANEQAVKIFEKDDGELEGRHITSLVHPGDRDIMNILEKSSSHQEQMPDSVVVRADTADGDAHFLEVNIFAQEADGVCRTVFVFTDVTSDIHLKKDRNRFQEQSRLIYNTIPIPTYTWWFDGDTFVLIAGNKSAAESDNERPNDWIGMTIENLTKNQPQIRQDISACYFNDHPVIREVDYFPIGRFMGGRYRVHAIPIPEDLVIMFVEDVTRQKGMESALSEQRERYLRLVESVKAVAFYLDENNSITYISPTIQDLAGYDPDYLIGRAFKELVDPEDVSVFLKEFDQIVNGTRESLEFSLVDEYQKKHTMTATLYPITIGDDQYGVIAGVMTEVGSRSNLTEQLERINRSWRGTFDAIQDLIIVIGNDDEIVRANKAFAYSYNRKPQDIIGQTYTDLLTQTDVPRLLFPKRKHPGTREMTRKEFQEPILGTYFTVTSSPYFTEEGQVIGTVYVFRDISERRKVEKELRNSEEKYRAVVENSLNSIVIIQDGRIVYANPITMFFMGYTFQELQSIDFLDLVHPDDRPAIIQRYSNRMTGKDLPNRLVCRVIRKNGGIYWVESRTVIIEWEGKSATLSVLSNITDRVEADEKRAYEQAIDGMLVGVSQRINRGGELDEIIGDLLAHSGETLKVSRAYLMELNEDREKVQNIHEWCAEGVVPYHKKTEGQSIEELPHLKDVLDNRKTLIIEDNEDTSKLSGDERRISIDSKMSALILVPLILDDIAYGFIAYEVIGGKRVWNMMEQIAVRSISNNITRLMERRRAKKYLTESKDFLEAIILTMSDGLSIVNNRGEYQYINPAMTRITGYTLEEVVGEHPENPHPYWPNDQEEYLIQMFLRTMEGNLDSFEAICLRKDAKRFPVLVSPWWIYDDEGNPKTYCAIVRDITEIKRAEEALRASEKKFRTIFESSRDGIYLTSVEGEVLDANNALGEMLGYSMEELFSTNTVRLYDSRKARERFQRDIEKEGFLIDYTLTLKKKDGTFIDCEESATVIRDGDGNIVGYQGIIRDVTERRKMEERLAQAERLSSMGGMLSGIAHELNNPITSVKGHADLLKKKTADPYAKKKAEIISKESDRCSKIVRGLLTFSRKHKPERRPIDINAIIIDSIGMLKSQLTKQAVVISTDLSDAIPPTVGDGIQLQQVFVNIITNAQDAMKSREEKVLTVKSHLSKGSVVITFSDTGSGIDKRIKKQIFDPFFTTKETGMGTGLGLSIAYGIIHEHGGKIEAENNEAGGAVFTVELPVVRPDTRSAPQVRSYVGTSRHASVLVVEPDEHLRSLLEESLNDAGYRVTTTGDGSEAKKLLKTDSFDTVVSAMKVPGVSGRALYAYLKKHDAATARRMVIITADVISEEAERFLEEMEGRYLAKPFPTEDLLRMLSRVLDS